MKTLSFKSKTAIVIGGTSGIGKATAKLLLENGAKVIVISKSQGPKWPVSGYCKCNRIFTVR